MRNYVTATQIIRNEKEFDSEKGKWIPFEDKFHTTAFNELKSFVAATARGNRRKRIFEANWYAVKDWGILSRLWYYPETGKVEYCCGQEWNSEMAILRDAFDWKAR